jgi:periplasmic protein TonB
MNATARFDQAQTMSSQYLDDSWQRLGWIIPTAVLLWAALLTIFGLLLEHTAPPPAELAPAQVRIIELPPAAGLQGGPPSAAPKTKAAELPPHPVVQPRPIPRAEPRHQIKPKMVPAVPPSFNGTAKPSNETPRAAESANKGGVGAPSSTRVLGEEGSGSAGLGSDSGGARAIFAPTPTIPDDLREEAFQTVAVAHFKVGYDGQSVVTLATPTENPRLNELILDTLKQWRFFPAKKDGVAINSEFDVRIPITVD